MIRALAPLIVAAVVGAQSSFAPLRSDGNGIAQLRRVVPVHVRDRSVIDAMRLIAKGIGVDLTAPADLPGLARHVTFDADTLTAAAALLELARGTDVVLFVSTNGPSLAIRRALDAPMTGHAWQGVVRDSATNEPIAGVELVTDAGRERTTTDNRGRFTLHLPAQSTIVTVRRIGFAPARVVADSGQAATDIVLARMAMPLSAMVVNPGFYGVMHQRLEAAQTLSREQIRAAPQLGEDIFRSVNRLPGVSGSDFSAAFRVRGGANDQVHTSIDGLELTEPFHLKDFDGALSIVDVGAIAGLDLTTGGFGAEYGNHLTGVVAMRTLDPRAESGARTEVALTLMTMRATSRGSFDENRGGWLLSARRGFLEYALRAAGEEDNLRPRYFDLIGKVAFQPTDRVTLSLHAMQAGDRLVYQDEDYSPRLVSAYGSRYVWSQLAAELTPSLRTDAVLSVGQLSWERKGTRVSYFDGIQDLAVHDDRSLRFVGLRQDWEWDASPNTFVRWGGEARAVRAEYLYDLTDRKLVARGGFATAETHRVAVDLSPNGFTGGVFGTVRRQLFSALTLETGLRLDHQSYTGETQVSPRVALAYALSPHITARAAWGRYAQPQGPHQLQTQDSLVSFQRAELAEHRVVGIERQSGSITTRLELYDRRLTKMRARFVSVDNSIDVFPEVEPDRRLIQPSSGDARGMELYVARTPAHRLTWAASYALARVEETSNGVTTPGTLDQRHTVALDVGWRPSSRWQLSAGWLFHTGWPATTFDFVVDTVSSNRVLVGRVYGPRNAERLPAYHRLDLRATRTFNVRGSEIGAFVDLFNAYGRRNGRAYDPVVGIDGLNVTLDKRLDGLFPRLPSIGLSWAF